MDDLLTDDFDCYDEDDFLDADETALTRDPPTGRAACYAAVSHELRGEYMEALIRYMQAYNAMSDDELHYTGWGKALLNDRRRIKRALGIELDSLEASSEVGEVERINNYFDILDMLREPWISHGLVHVWSRSELVAANEAWPVRINLESIVDYYHEVERGLRRLDQPVLVMHRTLTFFNERLDEVRPLLEKSRRNLTAIKWPRDDGVGIAWPPGRNESCWCGSGVKYKRCCGGVGLQSNRDLAWGPARLRAGAGLAVCRV